MEYLALVALIVIVLLVVIVLFAQDKQSNASPGQQQTFQSIVLDPLDDPAEPAAESRTAPDQMRLHRYHPIIGPSEVAALPVPIHANGGRNYRLTITRDGSRWGLSGTDSYSANDSEVSDQKPDSLTVTLIFPWKELATRFSHLNLVVK